MQQIKWQNGVLDLSRPVVMGILNITPDSFFDGGRHNHVDDVVLHAAEMIEQGAEILDVGAVSTRPGAVEVDEATEWKRLEPVMHMLRKNFPNQCISVDTYRSSIAEKAVNAGAAIINDISGGQLDQDMFRTVAAMQVPYIMMHMLGTPQTMQNDPQYEDVVAEVETFFAERLKKLKNLGMEAPVILDPGFGFGKTVSHNYRLLHALERFRALGCPVLAGVSRKSMINRVLKTKPENALNGTTVVNTLALLHGADILRVHDVREARQAVRIIEIYRANATGQ